MKKIFNKSFLTNFIAIIIIAVGYLSPIESKLIKSIGFFALSGAITNWLAVYMLFEKVPLLYGSGIIPNRFEEFKSSIKDLMMNQFFTLENVTQFILTEETKGSKVLHLDPLLDAIDYERIYAGLVDSIMESSLGSMLQMVGGKDTLLPLKEPLTKKIRLILTEILESERFKTALEQSLDANKISTDIISKVETVIDKRLNDLTPQMVKIMVQKIIIQHLGWLVVWGGIFGGAVGAGVAFL